MQILLLLVVAYAFLKTKNEKESYQTSDETVTVSGSAGQVTTDPKTGNTVIHASISRAKAKQVASAIKAELMNFFASEVNLLNHLKGLNDADYVLVFKEFGIQERLLIDNTLAPAGSFLTTVPEDLTQWLSREIQDTRNRAKLKSWFPTIF